MATEQVLNTRILLKYDTYENWMKSSSILKPGEVALATIDSGTTQEVGSVTPPQVLIKVGDGENVYSALPFASAKAADVYSWAKEASFPHDVTGTGNTIVGVTWANNKLTFTKGNRVEKVTAADKSITIGGTETQPTVKANISAETGNTLELKDDGLYVPTPAEVTLPSYTDNAVAGQFVTEVDQSNGQISVKRSTISYENLTDKPEIPTGFVMTAYAGDDDVIVLSGRGGVNSVAYYAEHAKKGPNGGATKGPVSAVEVSGYGASGSISVPRAVVDEYGHVTGLTEALLTITMPEEQTIPSITITDDTSATVPTADTVDVYKNLTANGHVLTEELVTVPTKAYVDKVVSAGMTFKGATSTLPANPEVGDMWKVSSSFAVGAETAKIGDTIVYSDEWYLIPSGDDIEDTWRAIQVNDKQVLAGGTSTAALNIANGTANGTFLVNNTAVTVKGVAENTQSITNLNTNLTNNYVSNTALTNKLSGYVTDSALAEELTNYVTTGVLNGTLSNYVSSNTLITNYYTADQTRANAAAAASQIQTSLIGSSSSASSTSTIYGAKKYAEEKAAAAQTYTDNIMAAFEGRRGIYVGYDATKKVYYAEPNPDVIFVYDCGGATF